MRPPCFLVAEPPLRLRGLGQEVLRDDDGDVTRATGAGVGPCLPPGTMLRGLLAKENLVPVLTTLTLRPGGVEPTGKGSAPMALGDPRRLLPALYPGSRPQVAHTVTQTRTAL